MSWDVLIGGAVTLAVTLVVQVFVIPRVQAWNRWLERWELDVVALATLLDDELPHLHQRLRLAEGNYRFLTELRANAELDQSRISEAFRAAADDERDARAAVDEAMAKAVRLERRLRRVKPKAPIWVEVLWRQTLLDEATLAATSYPSWIIEDAPVDAAAIGRAWEEVDRAREDLLGAVNGIGGRTRLPRTYPVRRAIDRLKDLSSRKLPPLKERWLRMIQRESRSVAESAVDGGVHHAESPEGEPGAAQPQGGVR
jgi:hypothetical protein